MSGISGKCGKCTMSRASTALDRTAAPVAAHGNEQRRPADADLQPGSPDADLRVRWATGSDQAAIVALVRRERLNPNGLHWPNFVVASAGDRLIGAVQMRRHADGSRELGSLVVDPQHRRGGVAQQLITHLLAAHEGRALHIVTAHTRAPYFARWRFHVIEPRCAPRDVRRNRTLGQWAGGLAALLRARLPRRLVVLERC